jgi:hypothetical protein
MKNLFLSYLRIKTSTMSPKTNQESFLLLAIAAPSLSRQIQLFVAQLDIIVRQNKLICFVLQLPLSDEKKRVAQPPNFVQ